MDLTRRAIDVNFRNLALGHDVVEAEGGTFVRNLTLPFIYDANFVFGITASDRTAIDRLLVRATDEYAFAASLTFRVDPFTPPSFEAFLMLGGFERSDTLVLLLNGRLRGRAPRPDIRPITDEAGWLAYTELKRLDCLEHARIGNDLEGLTLAEGLTSSNRLKCPPVQYMLAFEDDQPVGYCNAWEGVEGVGQIEDLFVHPASRRSGIATALIHHAVGIVRLRGAESVVIVVDPANTAKDLYTALGWQPVAVCRQYGKTTSGRAASSRKMSRDEYRSGSQLHRRVPAAQLSDSGRRPKGKAINGEKGPGRSDLRPTD